MAAFEKQAASRVVKKVALEQGQDRFIIQVKIGELYGYLQN
jgi:hypothetical protein